MANIEAIQHENAKLKLELDERKRELDNFEATVRQRERDVVEAEANARAAKMAEALAMQNAVQKPIQSKKTSLATDKDVALYLMNKKIPVTVSPKDYYDDQDIEKINKHGLIVTIRQGFGGYGWASLFFRFKGDTTTRKYQLDVEETSSSNASPGQVIMTLMPVSLDGALWSFFVVTKVDYKLRYPMPLTTLKTVETVRKPPPPPVLGFGNAAFLGFGGQ